MAGGKGGTAEHFGSPLIFLCFFLCLDAKKAEDENREPIDTVMSTQSI
jgi:hypothetical protein